MSSTLTPVSFRKPTVPEPRISKPHVPGKRHQRFWTEEERDVLRKYYPSGGFAACAAHLPQHRSTKSAIYAEVHKLGLKRNGLTRERQSHDYGETMDNAIRAAWPELDTRRKGVVNELADRLGVPRWWLTRRARELGLQVVIHKKEPPWTAAEDALMRRVPLHDPERCAEIFRAHGFSRSATAIMVKAKRLDLSRRATRPTLSAVAVAKVLGVDGKTVTSWILTGDLAAVKRDDRRLPQQGGSAWDIEKAELKRFIVENLGHIDFRKVDKFELVAILTLQPTASGEVA